MKTANNTKQTIHELSLQKQFPYPILSFRGRKEQSGEQKSPSRGGGFRASFNSSPILGEVRWGNGFMKRGISFSPPYGGGTFCEAKGGGAFGKGGSKRAFTLVELIIVITILAILATIAFMSFQGYMKQSRDAVRVSDLASASKGLSIFFTKSGVYPETESGVNITVNGNLLASQGSLGTSVVRAISMNQVPLDPVDQSKYTYSTNAQKTKYQLMSYTENASLASMMTQSYAQDLTDRGIQMQGDGLGIVLNTDNSLPTSEVETYTGTETYKIVFDNDTVMEGSGNLVFSQIYNMRDDLLKNKELAKFDQSLVGYWDMETRLEYWNVSTGTGYQLRDMSKYGNHGTCYNSGGEVSCGGGNGPQFVNGVGNSGKAMSFDGVDDWISIQDSPSLSLTGDGTIFFTYKIDHILTGKGVITKGVNAISGEYDYMMYLSGGNEGIPFIAFYSNNTSGGVKVYQMYYDYRNGKNNSMANTLVIGKKNTVFGDAYAKMSSGSTMTNIRDTSKNLMFMNGWNGFTDGLLDEVRIYNRALSDAEVRVLYQTTK